MESQPQDPEFRINPENFHPWLIGACAFMSLNTACADPEGGIGCLDPLS